MLFKDVDTLNIYSGYAESVGADIYYHGGWRMKGIFCFAIKFNLLTNEIYIADLFKIQNWTLAGHLSCQDDIQKTIDYYHNYYQKLKNLQAFI